MNRKRQNNKLRKVMGDMFRYPILNTIAALLATGGKRSQWRSVFAEIEKLCDSLSQQEQINVKLAEQRDELLKSQEEMRVATVKLAEHKQELEELKDYLKEFHPPVLAPFESWRETGTYPPMSPIPESGMKKGTVRGKTDQMVNLPRIAEDVDAYEIDSSELFKAEE